VANSNIVGKRCYIEHHTEVKRTEKKHKMSAGMNNLFVSRIDYRFVHICGPLFSSD